MRFQFTEERRREAERILGRYPTPLSAILPMLWLVQEQEGWVPEDACRHISELIGISRAEVREVASFYSMFEKEPPALHHIRICQSLCCGLKRSDAIMDHLKVKLGIGAGEKSADGRFRLSAVECLGMCGKAPSMMIGDECFEELTVEKVDEVLARLGVR